jgi:hypothetical protein
VRCLGKNRDQLSLIVEILQTSAGGATKNPDNVQLQHEFPAPREISVPDNKTWIYPTNRITIHINDERKRIPKGIQKPKTSTQENSWN